MANAIPEGHGQPPQRLRLLGWKPLRKNTLRGFIDVEVAVGNGRGLAIYECPVHVGANGRAWVALPAKPQLDRNGSVRRSIAGKIQFAPVIRWCDQATGDKFSAAAIKLLLARHPSVLDE
jgi:hypothetical protein